MAEPAHPAPPPPGTPPCFNSASEFALWVKLATESNMRDPATNYCWDCTPRYKLQMESEDRCTHPEIIFMELEDAGEWVIHGFSPKAAATLRRVKRARDVATKKEPPV